MWSGSPIARITAAFIVPPFPLFRLDGF